MGLQSLMRGSKAKMVAAVAFFQALLAANTNLEPADGVVGRARNTGTVIAVVVIGIVGLVGVLIFGEVWNAMPMSSGDPLYSEAEAIVGGFGDAMGLLPIILLVLLASVVIGVVQRMRGAGM